MINTNSTVDILGQPYDIIWKSYEDDQIFSKNKIEGFENRFTKQIVICDMRTHPNWKDEDEQTIQARQKHLLRHEIVHAFLDESGLSDGSFRYDKAWSANEEMVDWIALQGMKIAKAWQDVGAV